MSKILKQNGDNGKIMRAQTSGKVLRQNYNFGNKFKHATTYYLRIPNLDIDLSGDVSFGMWTKVNGNFFYPCYLSMESSSGIISFESASYDAEMTSRVRVWYGSQTENNSFNRFNGVNTGCFISYLDKTNLYSGLYYKEHAKRSLPPSFSSVNLSSVFEIKIGGGYTSTYGVDKVTSRSFGEVFIMNRLMSDEEMNYYNNNGLGNDLLSKNGLVCHFTYSKAELFDFGLEGQRVGMRDLSGNNYHAIIEGLPAGTVQEQLNYANANLFEIW